MNKEELKKENVSIERAEHLTTEGIFAMALTDEEYNIFCKGKEQGRKDKEDEIRNKIEEYFKENKENMASYGGLDILILDKSKLQELLNSLGDGK